MPGAKVQSALSALETDSKLSAADVQALNAYAESLDEHYRARRNAFEQRNEGSQKEWQAAFDYFLDAVNSVALLATDRSAKGIGEAIYDALGSASDVAAARQRILAILRG